MQRLLPSLGRLQPSGFYAVVSCRCQATQAEPKASQSLLDKMKDKDLLKVHGFIGGQWVGAGDGSTMEVTPHYHRGPSIFKLHHKELPLCLCASKGKLQ